MIQVPRWLRSLPVPVYPSQFTRPRDQEPLEAADEASPEDAALPNGPIDMDVSSVTSPSLDEFCLIWNHIVAGSGGVDH